MAIRTRATPRAISTFTLEGEKLHGRWHLVRMARRPGEKQGTWLLIKASDEAARESKDPDILEEEPLSVVSGRSIAEIAEGKGRKRVWHSNRSVQENVKAGATKGISSGRKSARRSEATQRKLPSARGSGAHRARPRPAIKKAKRAKRAERQERAKAKTRRCRTSCRRRSPRLRAEAPSGDGWVHEIKFDGYRIQARLDHGDVRLLTRKGSTGRTSFPTSRRR